MPGRDVASRRAGSPTTASTRWPARGSAAAGRAAQALAADPDAPPFFGRTDRDRGRTSPARRGVPHRPPARPRRCRRPGRDRLAGADLARVLPGTARRTGRASGCAAGSASTDGELDLLRGRAPRSRRGAGAGVGPAARGDRTPARRPDARHRRHHPARPGRAGAGRPRHLAVHPGRARHRQDGGRPAPRRLPALHLSRAAAPLRRAGRRPEPAPSCTTSRRCCPPSARAASSRRRWTSSWRTSPVAGRRAGRAGRPQGRCPDGRRAAPGRAEPHRQADRATSSRSSAPAATGSGRARLRRYVDDARRALGRGAALERRARAAADRSSPRTSGASARTPAGRPRTPRPPRWPARRRSGTSSTRSGRPWTHPALLARLYADAAFAGAARRC